jgi:FlaG/FlaF family flagellin (archaellin)
MRRKKSVSALINNVLHIKKQPSEYAVSEVVGTLLLIGIGISLVLVLALVTISIPNAFFSSPTPSVNIIGTVTDNSVILEHHGGDPVSIDSMIYLHFAETPYNTTIRTVLDSNAKADGYWNIGERIVIPYTGMDLSEMQVSILIIDVDTHSLILRGILQSGATAVLPYVRTLNADSLQSPYVL